MFHHFSAQFLHDCPNMEITSKPAVKKIFKQSLIYGSKTRLTKDRPVKKREMFLF